MTRSVVDQLAHARKFSSEGRYREAEAAYVDIIEQDPACAPAHHGLGVSLADQHRFKEAYLPLTTAHELLSNVETAYSLGAACAKLGRLDEAKAHLESALRFAPDHPEILVAYGRVREQRHELDEAASVYQKVLEHDPVSVAGLQMMARVLRRQKKPEMALTYVNSMPTSQSVDPVNLSNYYQQRAKCLEDLNRYDEAFMAYQQSANAQVTAVATLDATKRVSEKAILHELAMLDAISKLNTAPSLPYFGKSPVFVVGFPRSGTTLVESIIDSFENVRVLSEYSPIKLLQPLLDKKERANGPIGNKDHQFVEELRAEYWRLARCETEIQQSSLLIDKLPFNLVHARLIHILFPNAKFIFVQRHPMDACFSSFTQVFELNNYMAHFTNLSDTSNMYAQSMSVWQTAVSVLDLNVHVMRYESLVENFEIDVKAMLKFLILDWSESLLAFHLKAATKNITTPSYEQVTQDIYTTSRDRWKNYKPHLQSMERQLAPFIEAFGYGEDRRSG